MIGCGGLYVWSRRGRISTHCGVTGCGLSTFENSDALGFAGTYIRQSWFGVGVEAGAVHPDCLQLDRRGGLTAL